MPRMTCAVSWALIGVLGAGITAAEPPPDSPAAAATRKLLAGKISPEIQDLRLDDALGEIKAMCAEAKLGKFTFRYDVGVSRNITVTFQGKNKTVAEVLDGFFKKNGHGYIVISDAKNPYDGAVLIKQGVERGFPAGQSAPAGARKEESKGPPKQEVKPKSAKKDLAKTKETKDEPKNAAEEKPADDPDRAEKSSRSKLNLIKELMRSDVKKEKVKERLSDLIKDFPKTKAAAEARAMLEKMSK